MKRSARCRVVVLISGRGSNLQALLNQAATGELPAQFAGVISNRPGAAGLRWARGHGVPALAVDHTAYPNRTAFEQALMAQIDRLEPELVVLAGFMRILGSEFVAHYRGRMLNIHPSLLPRYRGLHTHRRVLQAGEREHGASVHFVTDAVDGGPLVIQARVPVHPGDDEDRLAARVLEQEHRIYPLAVRWFAQGRLRMGRGVAVLDGKPLDPAYQLDTAPIAVGVPGDAR